ncbi:MAG: hypothetical protein ROW48_07865 [Bellilinea sp.]
MKLDETFATLRDALERAGAHERTAIRIARLQASALARHAPIAAAPEAVPHLVLDARTTRRVTAYARELAEQAQRGWEAAGLLETCGTLAMAAHQAQEIAADFWDALLNVFTGHGAQNAAAWLGFLLGASDSFSAAPPLAVSEAGGVRLHFWNVPLALLMPDVTTAETLDELSLPLRILAETQWQIAGQVGAFLGSDRADLAWYPFAQTHQAGALRRFERFTGGERGILAESRSMLIEDPPEELRLAARALRFLAGEVDDFHVPALNIGRVTQGDTLLGFRLVANHALLSGRAIGGEVQRLLRRMRGGAQPRPLSADDGDFLRALEEAGLRTGQRAPRGFWDTFAARWNAGRGKHENPHALEMRWHRLRRKVAG